MDRAQIRTASAESCDRCHEAGMGERLIPLWQNATRTLYDNAAQRAEALLGVELDAEQSESFERARRLLDLVHLDGSWGVHNPTYTEKLLQDALDLLRSVQASVDSSPGIGGAG